MPCWARTKCPLLLHKQLQAEDTAVLHLLRKRIPDLPVLLDTGYHFRKHMNTATGCEGMVAKSC
jgi:3'-phosphoadenosine 5'-phosphosulfate sulfotransferase (PAPS reductase)/FAD synthetase